MPDKDAVFRRDLEAVRGVAIVFVLLFHLGVPGFGLGYLGVDIFFVLSGYLIAKLIHRQVETGKWSLREFYVRRAWRLLPTLYFVIACVLFGALVSPPSLRREIIESVPYAALGISNFYFFSTAGYFDDVAVLKPLLHVWSLSVEEQFYLLFALVFPLLTVRPDAKRALIIAMLVCCCAAAATWPLEYGLFYLLPGRALELMTGVLAFRLFPTDNPVARSLRRFTNVLSVGAIVALIPLAALCGIGALPVTLVLMAAVAALLVNPGAASDAILGGNAALATLGRAAYPIYLVHWPLISFAHINGLAISSAASIVALAVLSVALGWILSLTIERPLYFDRGPGRLLPVPRLLAATAILLGGSWAAAAVPARLWTTARVVNYADYFRENYYPRHFQDGRYGSCFIHHGQGHVFDEQACLHPAADRRNVLVLGDSHAAYLAPGVRKVLDEFAVLQSTVVSCPLLLDSKRDETCQAQEKLTYEFVARNSLDLIVVYANWRSYDFQSLGSSLDMLGKHASRVVVVVGTPFYSKDVARILYDEPSIEQAQVVADSLDPFGPGAEAVRNVVAIAAARSVPVISIPGLLCSDAAAGRACRILDDEGHPIFYDHGHLSTPGAVYLSQKMRNELLGARVRR